MRWGSNEVKIKAKDKRRNFTPRATETQRAQRREDIGI
jgi:hypothetical protein